MSTQGNSEVREWLARTFQDELPLTHAVTSLDNNPLIELRKSRINNKYTYFLKGTNGTTAALFCHPAILNWTSPLDTGNYVPENQVAPEGVPENRIKSEASWQCELSYGFDMTADSSLFQGLKALEDFANHDPNFNQFGRARVRWQTRLEDVATYVLTAPLFAKKTPHNSTDPGYPVHPWIEDALRQDHSLVPNPERPTILDFDGEELKSIDDSLRGELQRGDVLWCSFTVSYVIGRKDWRPEIRPYEMIRVGRCANPGPSNSDASTFPPIQRRTLAVGKITSFALNIEQYRAVVSGLAINETVSADDEDDDDSLFGGSPPPSEDPSTVTKDPIIVDDEVNAADDAADSVAAESDVDMTDEGGQRNVRDNDTLENVDEKGPVPGPRSASKRASPTGPRTPPPPPGRGNRPESAKEHTSPQSSRTKRKRGSKDDDENRAPQDNSPTPRSSKKRVVKPFKV